jgi:diguanylate cyclase (GGDEF)-like protein
LGLKSLWQVTARHPLASIRDAAVISALMTFVVLLTRHYDLFEFFAALADPDREISPSEAVLIAVLFGACMAVFVMRRMRDDRYDALHDARLAREIRELRELAMQDPLTKLPNRRVLLAAIDSAIADWAATGATHAFFMLDLNGFKRVNDAFGHAAGDTVLQVVVDRFRGAARPADLIARLGGDEFAVLACNVDRTAASSIGERFATALDRIVTTGDGNGHQIGVAIGGAIIPDHGKDSETILRHADLAMYRAKTEHGSAIAFFDPAIDAAHSSRKANG